MDKITHQVRAEHWTRILNECMNSGMPKNAWCRANGISEKQFFYWQRILRQEAYEASQNPPLPVACFLASNFPHFHRYNSLKSALYIHAVLKNINTFPKNQGRIRAAIAVEILDFTVMYR